MYAHDAWACGRLQRRSEENLTKSLLEVCCFMGPEVSESILVINIFITWPTHNLITGRDLPNLFLRRNHSNLSIQFGKVIVRAERCKASKSMCGLWLCKRASLTNSRTISKPIKTSACSFVEIWGDFLTQKLHTEPQRAARKHSMVLRAAHIGKATTRICTWSSESTSEINQREQFILNVIYHSNPFYLRVVKFQVVTRRSQRDHPFSGLRPREYGDGDRSVKLRGVSIKTLVSCSLYWATIFPGSILGDFVTYVIDNVYYWTHSERLFSQLLNPEVWYNIILLE